MSFNWFRSDRAIALLVVCCLLLIGVVAGIKAREVNTQYDLDQFLPEGHPALARDLEARRQFGVDPQQPLLVTLERSRGDWLQRSGMVALERATRAVAQVSGVTQVQSLATVESVREVDDQLVVAPTAKGWKGRLSERRAISSNRLLSPSLVSKDGRSALLVVRLDDLHNEQLMHLMGQVRQALEQALPNDRVALGGVPAIQIQLTELVKSELLSSMGLALLLSVVAILLVFRTWSAIVIPLTAISLNLAFLLALMAQFGWRMTALAITIPILVSVVVLSLVVHTLLRLAEEQQLKGQSSTATEGERFKLVWGVLRELALPNALTALTTALGFATLALTDVPLVREFGLAVSVTMVVSWVLTQLCLFPLALLLPIPEVRSWAATKAEWSSILFWKARWTSIGLLAVCAVCVWAGQSLSFSARLFDDLPTTSEARRATERIDRKLGGTVPIEILVTLPKGQTWTELSALKRLDSWSERLRSQVELGSVMTLADVVRQANQRRLPATEASLQETLFLMSLSGQETLRSVVSEDRRTVRLAARFRDVPGDRLQSLVGRIESSIRTNFPGAEFQAAGMGATIHTMNNGLSRELILGFWPALAVISVLLFATLRSVRWTLVAILPNLLPTAILLGILAWMETPIKPGLAIIFSIALGIAFNNTVYLLERLRHIIATTGSSVREAIQIAVKLETHPCLISTFCLLVGFVIFLFSDFSINQTFGTYMIVSLGLGLVGDLIFLPALIYAFPQILEERAMPKPAETGRLTEKVLELTPTAELSRAASIVAIVGIFGWSPISGAASSKGIPSQKVSGDTSAQAEAVLNRVRTQLALAQESAVVQMIVREADGTTRTREMEMERLSQRGFEAVKVRMKAPSDLRGLAFMAKRKGESEEQWLFTPSSGKARRVVASDSREQRLLDSEISVEDLSPDLYRGFKSRLARREGKTVVIESFATRADSPYSKLVTHVRWPEGRIEKTESHDRQGRLLKTIVFRDYQKVGGALRAGTLEVRNMQTRRGTILKMSGFDSTPGLSTSDFTADALEDDGR
jgi:hypothetical protein